MATVSLEIGKSYTFSTQAAAYLGDTIENVKLISIMDYETAVTYENIDLKFRTIYPALPKGLPDSPKACVYYRFTTEAGEKIILANYWILMSSVAEVTGIDFSITFTRSSLDDMRFMKENLNSMGYTNFEIKRLN